MNEFKPSSITSKAETLKMALAVNEICTSRNNCSNCPIFFGGICLAGPDKIPASIKEKVYKTIENVSKNNDSY